MAPMSPTYFVFAGIACLLYWLCAPSRRLRMAALLLANLFFLARFGLFYPVLITAAATTDYLVGLGLQAASKPRVGIRRFLLSISLLVNLGLLVGAKCVPLALSAKYAWIFPLSLSFYCFQSLTYTIDAYRGDGETTRSYLAHLTSTSLFVVIIAGPINRLSGLIKQLERPFQLTKADGGRAMLLIGVGLVKKLLIADYLADNLVNRVFDTPTLYSGAEVLIGVFGYALQLYYDFSGYTDIAMGVGQFFGLQLPDNFNRPYLSVSVIEFWKRWHITFSRWLMEYLYFWALPSSRKWKPWAYINSVITMILGGLWHGLTWNFAIWGLLHGSALAVVRLFQTWRGRRTPTLLGTWLSTALTFVFVCFAWVFFRAATVKEAWAVLGRIASMTYSVSNITQPMVGVLSVAVVFCVLPKTWYSRLEDYFGRAPFVVQGAALAGIVIALQFLAGRGSVPFVYSNF